MLCTTLFITCSKAECPLLLTHFSCFPLSIHNSVLQCTRSHFKMLQYKMITILFITRRSCDGNIDHDTRRNSYWPYIQGRTCCDMHGRHGKKCRSSLSTCISVSDTAQIPSNASDIWCIPRMSHSFTEPALRSLYFPKIGHRCLFSFQVLFSKFWETKS